MSSKLSAAIIHGTGGHPQENWIPWLKSELQSRGVETKVPQFPTPEGQSLEAWLKIFQLEIGEVTEDLVLFGHSLGVALILNVLQQSQVPARGTFLVSGFVGALGLPGFDPLNKSFFPGEFDWAQIRRNSGKLFIYTGDNDPYVPLEKGHDLARNLKSELIVIPGGGHLNQAAGFTTFPRLIHDFESSAVLRGPS